MRRAGVAQLAEQLICNQQVAGSIPIASSICGWVPEWPKGADCKSAVSDFDGSNPSPSTTFISHADMAELADAYGSGPYEGNFMEVQVLLSAPIGVKETLLRFSFGKISPVSSSLEQLL